MKIKILFVLSLLIVVFNSYGQDFVKRDGKKLKYKGEEILLRGMAFGNVVYNDNFSPSLHHSEIDLQRVHNLGMNAIRFYLNYKTFENDANPYTYKQSGWDWIDKNVEWAKNHGIFLILNMHVPQGGYQSTCGGDALWTNPENQKRLAALWKAIASRYKDEPQIGAYDILNEPTPSGSIQNWSNLAQRIIDSIRSVDNNHLIITERALALDCDYSYSDANNNYPQITEENLMYTVHLYDPYEFTHQNLDWANTGEGGKYPDENFITAPSDATYFTGNYTNPSIGSGTKDWTYFTGKPYTVIDDEVILGRVVFVSNKIGAGKVYFDDFVLKELDASGNEIRTIYSENLSSGTYWWYSADGTGAYKEESSVGHNDNYSISISGNQAAATVICPNFSFKSIKGHKYVVSGWMKGENVPAGATASITTEFYNSPSNTQVGARNYQFLVEKITAYSKYIEEKGYPVYFGEFGAARNTFDNDKGGDRWVADALQIFDSLGYHFTYHSYKESSFGLYDGWDKPVDTTTINTALEKVFREFFGTTTSLFSPKGDRKSSLLLYPNPGSEYLNIGNPENIKISKIEVCDLFGNVVISSSEASRLDIHSLAKGSYIILMHHSGGVMHGKWIKQ
ncbi:retaining beta-glycosidase [Sporocytophaga myxococcoides]|uniref:Retaining beta-glycosidase n=1 Tax=Sporocytophaga myxococcoides TaxID=153721 RepID=A0A098LC42_9BACT|nr:cellulase family glycosylhydrolase [Sporocytophaga myxococcoides]GAL84525.1 retaining beta-glycosidase [Sporocytophaga myxococcoides]